MKVRTVKGTEKKHEDVTGMRKSSLMPREDRSICILGLRAVRRRRRHFADAAAAAADCN